MTMTNQSAQAVQAQLQASQPTSYQETLRKALDPKFLLEYAVGWEDDSVLIERFGIPAADWRRIKKDKYYQSEISRIRAEMEKDGRMSRYKARLLAHDLIDVVYKEALQVETPLDKKIEALKVLSNLADMGPKQNKAEVAASGVTITLNLAPQAAAPAPQPISVEVQPQLADETDKDADA